MWLWKCYRFRAGKYCGAKGWPPEIHQGAKDLQATRALMILRASDRSYWWCRDRFFWENEGLSAEDVYALVYERDQRKQRRLDRAHAALAAGSLPRGARRDPLPREVRKAVFERYEGKCAEWESSFDLQYDHIIPVALGGASSAENLQLLCAECNQKKGASL